MEVNKIRNKNELMLKVTKDKLHQNKFIKLPDYQISTKVNQNYWISFILMPFFSIKNYTRFLFVLSLSSSSSSFTEIDKRM